ncbi:UNVERIFIED_CONTAM: hypothetical protein Sangu_1174900 [Sesamum angustifolium]|uniref:Uncharacterized protein n=1 Tax=Sesamum angustifolium TaxID=2727405 RepID=A0AAW2NHJ0_9LAMI
MESELGQFGSSLSLTEEEETGLVFPTGLWHSESLAMGFFVVGRLISSKSFIQRPCTLLCEQLSILYGEWI